MDHPKGAVSERGAQISSDGGLLVMRELDDALGLSDLASAALRDNRRAITFQLAEVAIQTPTERKRKDRSVCRAGKPCRRTRILQRPGPICQHSTAPVTADDAPRAESLICWPDQSILTSTGSPPGECRLRSPQRAFCFPDGKRGGNGWSFDRNLLRIFPVGRRVQVWLRQVRKWMC